MNVPVLNAVQGVVESAKQVGQSKNDRVNAMATANMLTPSHTRKLWGFSGINGKDITVSIDAMDEAVGIAAREAMSLCTSIYK